MLSDAIYHNPRCSKSRATLALLQERGLEIPVIEYLKDPPTPDTLLAICQALQCSPLQLMRSKEPLFKELGLSKQDQRPLNEWCQLMHDHPSLIERPIVVYKGKAALGRPPENVLALLD